jgi:hypothetical protein
VRHVADGPTDFDALGFARTVAAKEPRRHGLGGLAAGLTWRGLAVPRTAWVLLLLAALLTAMVAGLMAAGVPRQPQLPAVVPPLGCLPSADPDEPGPVDQERPARSASPAIAFDRHAGRIVLLAPSAGAGAETWTFDVCSNAYTRMRPASEPVLLEASHLIYDSVAEVTIATDGRTTWAYDLDADTWTLLSPPPAVAEPAAPPLAYDPVSGLVIALVGQELWSYAVGTDTWALVSETPWLGPAVLAYDTSVDRIVADSGSGTWLYDIRNDTWSAGADPTFCVWGMAMVVPEVIVYDEAVDRTVVSCGTRAAYDATAGRWEYMTDIPGSFPSAMTFDSVNERLVGIGEIQDGVFAFDLRTRERIVLLEPVKAAATS